MSHPFPIFGSQDLKDDDGAVIDSLLIETDTPPDLKYAVEPIPVPDLSQPIRTTTRLITGTLVLTTATTPIMLLPSDPNRLQFKLFALSFAASPTVEDYLWVADEQGKVSAAQNGAISGAARIRTGKEFSIDVHTGAIYVAPNTIITGNIEITYWSTTS